ncbi:MAG: polysaccharide deacetylase family protein [Candidatus Omnitrophota bacterium]
MGILTIAFDDCYADTFNHCASFLAENGIIATFAVPSSHIGQTLEERSVMDVRQLLCLRNSGHEIASHTSGHRNLLEVYNAEGENAVREEMASSKKELGFLLNTYVTSMVFPFIESSQNPFLRKLASEYYLSSRITTEKPVFNPLPVEDAFSITGLAFTRETPVEEYNKLVDALAGTDSWLIEVFHLVSDKNTKSAHRDEPYRFFTPVEDFKKHISYILSKKIPIMTQGQVIKKHKL